MPEKEGVFQIFRANRSGSWNTAVLHKPLTRESKQNACTALRILTRPILCVPGNSPLNHKNPCVYDINNPIIVFDIYLNLWYTSLFIKRHLDE